MYLRLPLDTPTAAYNRSAALWIAMFAFTLMPSETACSVWCQERAVVRLRSSICVFEICLSLLAMGVSPDLSGHKINAVEPRSPLLACIL